MRGHELAVSRLKLVLIVVCLIAIPLTFWLNHRDVGSVNNRVTKVESPCQRYGPDSKICERAFEEAAASINHRMACFFQHRAGVFPPSCRGVHLRIKQPTPHKGGGALQTGSTGHQQPSPHHGGSPGSGHQQHPSAPHHAAGHHVSQPPDSGATDAPSQPNAASVPDQSPPPAVLNPAGKEVPANPPGLLPSTIEAAGNAVGKAGEVVDGTLCAATSLLHPCSN
jgi:hypothetical protein